MFSAEDKKNETPESLETEKAQPQSYESDYKDQFLRLNADFQNYKRRIERERTEWTHIMQADIIEKMLPLVDDLERAVQTAEGSQAAPAWIEGFQLILKNFKKTLTSLGVEEIVATGTFNPELHEALMNVESSEHQSGNIVQLLSKGYTFKGKVIKHARVSVAK